MSDHGTAPANKKIKIDAAPRWAWILLVVVVAGLMIFSTCSGDEAKDADSPPPAEQGQVAQGPAAPVAEPQVTKIGKIPRLYKFADFPNLNGCAVTEYLHSDVSFYPKGGTVTIHAPPPSTDSWEDTPGVPSSHEGNNIPPGQYTICQKDPKSWGIEVWN